MTAVTRDDQQVEQIVEEIEATTGPFWSADLAWTGDGHWQRLAAVIAGMERAGLIRPLDLPRAILYIRTDIPCEVEEPVLTIYRLYDADGCLLYVGCTSKTLEVRFRGHQRVKKWWPEVARVEQEQVTGWAAAHEVEFEAIRTEEPLYNVIGNPTRLSLAERRAIA